MGTIAVTGAHGRVGSELVRRGCIPIEANVTDFYALNQELLDLKPDVVIHCAAKTNVDACETQAMEAMKVNAGGVYGLAQVFQGKIVYLSTDYIFDGESGPYDETDKPNPISIYGWSKLGGEIALRNRHNPQDLIIRTTVLFDKNSPNFVTRIADKLLAGKGVEVPSVLYGSPTYIPHLADGILAAIDQDVTGVLNIAGDEVISRFQLACKIGEMLGVDVDGLVFSGPVTGRAPRPVNAGLTVYKALILDVPIFSPYEGVKEVLDGVAAMEKG